MRASPIQESQVMKTVTCQNLSQRGNFSNEQVQHFPNLYLTKIAGLQTESFSNLRTSAVCRTHVGQKNEKGFYIKRVLLVDTLVNSTYIVCFLFETWLVCCSCIMSQAQKTNNIYNRNGSFLIQLVNMNLQLLKQLCSGYIVFRTCPFPTKLVLS